MKRYLRLGCTVCKRTIDKLVDNVRVVPDRCTITLNCQGRLLPLEYRSNGEIAVAPNAGTVDWYPRGQTPTSSIATTEPSFINTATGTTQQLVLAVQLPFVPGPSSTAAMTLNVRAETAQDFRQYTYRFETGFSTVSGVETAVERKTLRFTAYGANPDIVEVYLNGVKQERGTNPDQFQIYDGTITSTVPPNMISFNTPVVVTSTTQVDVIVSKAVVLTQNFLSFFKNVDNPARTNTGAWENVDSYSRFTGGAWREFYVFTYDVLNTSDIALNTIVVPTGDVLVVDGMTSLAVPLTQCHFMLARQPYSTLDRYTDTTVPLSGLSMDRDYLKYHAVGGVPTLEITETSLVTFFPPARLTRFDPELTIKTPIAGVDEQLVIDGQVIVGPDT